MERLKLFVFALVIIFLNASASAFAQETAPDSVRVGIVIDGPSVFGQSLLTLVKEEVSALMGGEFDIQFPSDKTIVADWTVARNTQAVDRLLADGDVDVVLTLGIIASNDVIGRGPLPKPVIATLVLDLS